MNIKLKKELLRERAACACIGNEILDNAMNKSWLKDLWWDVRERLLSNSEIVGYHFYGGMAHNFKFYGDCLDVSPKPLEYLGYFPVKTDFFR